ncbi:MAG: hypothetical protein EOO40_03045 [Deltaproteobacteria bacterium]|nr:MAG: hypothetical protein EOO40_03045 [Deltaproteobacteria bacterium]
MQSKKVAVNTAILSRVQPHEAVAVKPHVGSEHDASPQHGPFPDMQYVYGDGQANYDAQLWGSPEQLEGALQALQALTLVPAAHQPTALLYAVLQRANSMRRAHAHACAVLHTVRRQCEAAWRRPAVPQFVAQRLFCRELFAAYKVIDLLRLGRTPLEVEDGFVRAQGALHGEEIDPRDLFFQRFAPRAAQPGQVARASGKVVLLAPGLGETGRHFVEQIETLCRGGHEVVIFDQQWAGQSRDLEANPPDGHLDRGFGIARDIACMAAHIVTRLRPGAPVVLLGQGTGAAAVLMMLVAQRRGELPVTLPKMHAVLQSPYLSPTPSGHNRLLGLMAKLPGLHNLQAQAFMPKPGHSNQAARRAYLQTCVRDRVQTRLGSLLRLRDDLRLTWQWLREGSKPQGRLVVLHNADDPWADPAQSYRLTQQELLGPLASVRILQGADHGLAFAPEQRQEVLWGMQKLAAALPAAALA